MSSGWNCVTHMLRVQRGQKEISMELAAHGMALRTCWEFRLVETGSVWNEQPMAWCCASAERSKSSKRGQHGINSPWHGVTHPLRVQSGRNKVSMELKARGMGLRTSWEFKGWKWGQYQFRSRWNSITHQLRVQIGQNKVSIEWKAYEM